MHGDSFIETQKYPMKPSSTSSCKRSIGNMALTSLLISELSKPPCVTISISEGVGRCADYIFRDHRNVLNIYIYAPVDARYKNCVEVLKMKPEEATKMIYKVDKAHTREYGGNGIGLSIVKAIMESFHQKYGVRNFDNGVEFWFELDGKSALHEEQNAIK